ncbi:MAG: hypothetical protein HEQ32_00920 [Vampirovibrio sp.]
MMNISSPAAYGFMPSTGAHARVSSAPTPVPTPELQQRSGGLKNPKLDTVGAFLSLMILHGAEKLPSKLVPSEIHSPAVHVSPAPKKTKCDPPGALLCIPKD